MNNSAFQSMDLSVTLPPNVTSRPEDIPRRSFTGVEIGVMTVAIAIAVITLCFMLSVVTGRGGGF